MKRIFAIPILIFASFMMFLYVVLPQILITSKAKRDFLKTEKEVNDRQQYFTGLKDSLEEMTGYQGTLEKIEAALPGEISLASLIEFFDQKASSNGLILKSFAPVSAPTDDKEQVEKSPAQYFTLVLNGSITSFEGFIRDIETSARLVDVESISFQQGLGETSSNINVLLKVYY